MFGLDDKRCWTGDGSYSKFGSSGQCQKARKEDLSMGLTDKGTMYVYEKDGKGKMTFVLFCFLYFSKTFLMMNVKRLIAVYNMPFLYIIAGIRKFIMLHQMEKKNISLYSNPHF